MWKKPIPLALKLGQHIRDSRLALGQALLFGPIKPIVAKAWPRCITGSTFPVGLYSRSLTPPRVTELSDDTWLRWAHSPFVSSVFLFLLGNKHHWQIKKHIKLVGEPERHFYLLRCCFTMIWVKSFIPTIYCYTSRKWCLAKDFQSSYISCCYWQSSVQWSVFVCVCMTEEKHQNQTGNSLILEYYVLIRGMRKYKAYKGLNTQTWSVQGRVGQAGTVDTFGPPITSLLQLLQYFPDPHWRVPFGFLANTDCK